MTTGWHRSAPSSPAGPPPAWLHVLFLVSEGPRAPGLSPPYLCGTLPQMQELVTCGLIQKAVQEGRATGHLHICLKLSGQSLWAHRPAHPGCVCSDFTDTSRQRRPPAVS